MTTEKLYPAQAVRVLCTGCLGMSQWSREKIEACQGDLAYAGPCPLFNYRLGKRIPIKVFRRYCLHCTNGDRAYVESCPTTGCPVHPYRFGTNPSKKGQGANAERMKRVRESKILKLEAMIGL